MSASLTAGHSRCDDGDVRSRDDADDGWNGNDQLGLSFLITPLSTSDVTSYILLYLITRATATTQLTSLPHHLTGTASIILQV
jgi:hypothetical protein